MQRYLDSMALEQVQVAERTNSIRTQSVDWEMGRETCPFFLTFISVGA